MQLVQTKNTVLAQNDRQLNKAIAEIMNEYLLEKYPNENSLKTNRRYLQKYFKFLNIKKLDDYLAIAYPDLKKLSIEFINSYHSASTKRVIIACLRSFYGWLVDTYNYHKNPIPNSFNLPARKTYSTTTSTDLDGLGKILRRLQDYSILGYTEFLTFALVRTLATTSLRISEILQITIEQIKKETITCTLKRGKEHTIKLPTKTKAVLLQLAAMAKVKQGPIFVSKKTGKPITRNYAYYLIKKDTGLTPHSFRKTFIEVMKTKGHSNKEITAITGQSENMPNYYDTRTIDATIHLSLDAELAN